MRNDQQVTFRVPSRLYKSLVQVVPHYELNPSEAMRLAVETFACAAWLRLLRTDEQVRERYGERIEEMERSLSERLDELDRIAFEPEARELDGHLILN
jgi:antitoxin component of RelBE/YafQ-DinJ toxin-antitoxin module